MIYSENTYSVPAGWILTLSRTLEFHGCSSKDIFALAGLDINDITDSCQRIPVAPVNRIWHLAEKQIGNSTFGLDTHRFINPTTFHALGIALWSSSTLKDALERLARYGKVLNNAAIKSFEETDDSWCLTVSVLLDINNEPMIAYQDLDGFFATIITICRTIYHTDYKPTLLELQRSQPQDTMKHEELFQCPVVFSESDNRMFFDKKTINAPLMASDPDTARQAEELTAKRLSDLDKDNLSNQVYLRLLEILPSGNSGETEVATSLHITLRQLQRKLSDEGTNFRSLLDKTRNELAHQYIRNDRIAINEIAYLLGFSEAANFSRAFKRWTGKSPGNFRAGIKDSNTRLDF